MASASPASLDMRPLAGEVVQKILEQRKNNAGKPLVVIPSECHALAAQIALPQIIMEQLRQSAPSLKIAHGIERSYTLLEDLRKQHEGLVISADQRGTISAADPNGEELISAYLKYEIAPGAPITRRNVLSYCQNHGISVRAVDTASITKVLQNGDKQGYLDQTDTLTRDIIKNYAPELLDTEIESDSAPGMWLRNIMAVERSVDHINASEADIYVLPYGGAHPLGWKKIEGLNKDDYPAEQALAPLFRNKGIDVMVLFHDHPRFGPENFPEDVDPEILQRTIILEGVSHEMFWHDSNNPPGPEEKQRLIHAESAFLREMNRQSGGALLELSPEIQQYKKPNSSHPVFDC